MDYYKSIEEVNEMFEYIPDRIVCKSSTYKIYLLSQASDIYYRLKLSDSNIFPYYPNGLYLMNYRYKDEWYTFYIQFENIPVERVISSFRGKIMSTLRRLSGDNNIDYKNIVYLTHNWSDRKFPDGIDGVEYV